MKYINPNAIHALKQSQIDIKYGVSLDGVAQQTKKIMIQTLNLTYFSTSKLWGII